MCHDHWKWERSNVAMKTIVMNRTVKYLEENRLKEGNTSEVSTNNPGII